MTSPTVGQVMLDYSVRAESAAGHLRNALQIAMHWASGQPDHRDAECQDWRAVARLVRDALAKLESRGVS